MKIKYIATLHYKWYIQSGIDKVNVYTKLNAWPSSIKLLYFVYLKKRNSITLNNDFINISFLVKVVISITNTEICIPNSMIRYNNLF